MCTLYAHATILTLNKNREVILDGAVMVVGMYQPPSIGILLRARRQFQVQRVLTGATGNRITAVLEFDIIGQVLPADCTIVDLQGKILLPGLINTHSHVAQSLLRGLAEDLPLHPWFCQAVWPLEATYRKEDGYVAARLTIAEMLKSGYVNGAFGSIRMFHDLRDIELTLKLPTIGQHVFLKAC